MEFHEERALKAREEFQTHGISDNVTVHHRDVIQNGFPESIDHSVDAVFLDIPAPYKCIDHVIRALKTSGGLFANFSPCIEQVQRTCDKLRENGFVNVKTIEIVDNKKNVKTFSMPLPDFGLELEELIEADIIPDVRNSSSGYLSKVSQVISSMI